MRDQSTAVKGAKYFNVTHNVWGIKEVFVNVYFLRDESSGNWILVDAGLKWSAGKIKEVAQTLFGGTPPTAIVLTHGHFDHVGSVIQLTNEWNTPVFAHLLELPYLTGKSSYPPPDPTVGGGMMSLMSPLYPSSPIDLKNKVSALPQDGNIPGMPSWKYLHTPGHTAGHISLFNAVDKIIIAGDAFVTTKAESAISVLTSKPKFSGPPKYFTPDWTQSKESVGKLAALNADIIATGHGMPQYGEVATGALNYLYEHFEEIAVPESGRYVNEPARADETGTTFIPPAVNMDKQLFLISFGAVLLSAFIISIVDKKRAKKRESFSTDYFRFEEQVSPIK